jgi:TetR/AcrR family transcriptional repressor of lmrAB and yxaGH operons
MVRVAAGQLALRGLDGTSFKTVLDESKAPRGSIYHHFPNGKDQLVGEAVRLAGERLLSALRTLYGRPAEDVVHAFFAGWRTVLTRSHGEAGCAVAAVVVANPESADLHGAVAAVFGDWTSALETLLEHGGIDATRSRPLASTLIAAAEGALIVARATDSLVPFDDVHAAMVTLVSALR